MSFSSLVFPLFENSILFVQCVRINFTSPELTVIKNENRTLLMIFLKKSKNPYSIFTNCKINNSELFFSVELFFICFLALHNCRLLFSVVHTEQWNKRVNAIGYLICIHTFWLVVRISNFAFMYHTVVLFQSVNDYIYIFQWQHTNTRD